MAEDLDNGVDELDLDNPTEDDSDDDPGGDTAGKVAANWGEFRGPDDGEDIDNPHPLEVEDYDDVEDGLEG